MISILLKIIDTGCKFLHEFGIGSVVTIVENKIELLRS